MIKINYKLLICTLQSYNETEHWFLDTTNWDILVFSEWTYEESELKEVEENKDRYYNIKPIALEEQIKRAKEFVDKYINEYSKEHLLFLLKQSYKEFKQGLMSFVRYSERWYDKFILFEDDKIKEYSEILLNKIISDYELVE